MLICWYSKAAVPLLRSSNSKTLRLPRLWYTALAAWLVLNLWQAAYTGLDPDEAYYWMYGQRLDWGYFDHPPLVALLTRVGAWLPGELGLRLGNVLVGALTWAGLWQLVGQPRSRQAVYSLLAVLVALPMLQIYAFIATPDGPLLCAAVWFFVVYRRFLQSPTLLLALCWGATMALLLYAKYHGILVIGFTVFAYRGLWRDHLFYVAAIFGAALYMPHLYWQYAHDFPSVRYHLSGRGEEYQANYTFIYLANQLVVAGPLIFPLVGIALAKLTAGTDRLLQAVRWLTLGILGFFFLSTFKGNTEAQWTAVLSIGYVYVTVHYAATHPGFRRWLWRLGAISGLLFLALRVWLAVDAIPLPASLQSKFEHHEWITQLVALAKDRPLIFKDTYRDPSLVRFYTGHPAWTITDADYRASQYDLWPDEQTFQGQDVLFIGLYDWPCPGGDSVRIGRRKFGLCPVSGLQVANRVRIQWSAPQRIASGQPVTLPLTFTNPYPYAIDLQHPTLPFDVALLVLTGTNDWTYIYASTPLPDTHLAARSTATYSLTFAIPDSITGRYPVSVGLAYQGIPPMLQSPVQEVVFE